MRSPRPGSTDESGPAHERKVGPVRVGHSREKKAGPERNGTKRRVARPGVYSV